MKKISLNEIVNKTATQWKARAKEDRKKRDEITRQQNIILEERVIVDFINSIDNKTYNLIRNSQSDAECRRYLRNLSKKSYENIFSIISDETDLFENYILTDLMVLKRNGRVVRANENLSLYEMLRQKLSYYGVELGGQFEREGLTLRAISLKEGFPYENEDIFKQLYGFDNFKAPIHIKSFEKFALFFDYDIDSGECELQRFSFGEITFKRKFESFKKMMVFVNNVGYKNIK